MGALESVVIHNVPQMLAIDLDPKVLNNPQQLERRLQSALPERPSGLLVYCDARCPVPDLAAAIANRFPGVPSLGCTSFLGVCTPAGFKRGAALLAFEARDGIELVTTMVIANSNNARSIAERAAAQLVGPAGEAPSMLLMHATPGFEEQLLEGLQSRLGSIPIFGGSAADDTVTGEWSIHCNGRTTQKGAVFAAIRSSRRVQGAFVGGYLPTEHQGVITRAEGRIVHEIDGKPAARVYNEWTNGAITSKLATGGRILGETNLLPLGRPIVGTGAMPRRLLAHPESVVAATGSLALFSSIRTGERVQLMTNTTSGLIPRMRRSTERASEGNLSPRGGLLVYCAGSLSSTQADAADIGKQFREVVGDVPFVGISTFGEQGSFFSKGCNYHGNLMCSTVLFE